MTISWILVSNATESRIYTTPRAKLFDESAQLKLISTHNHPTSRLKRQDLTSDKAGNFSSSKSSTYDSETDPKDHEMSLFARELSQVLEQGRQQKQFEDLILVAPPQFLGMLLKHCNGHVTHFISVKIEKDYTKFAENDIVQHISAYL